MRLLEKTRNQLVSDSRSAKAEKDGKNRYQKRLKSRIGSSVRQYNSIDMNKFFKKDILDFGIQVYGETDNYIVTISLGNVLSILKRILSTKDTLELKDIIIAITRAFNGENVYIHCSCPDWTFRMAYYASKKDINAGQLELRPSIITNPDDSLGDGCKHSLLVLSNTTWIIKVARVIFNYINFMRDNQKRLYADFIYPAVYGKKFEEPVQTDMFDDELQSKDVDIDKSNEYARQKGQFKPGNDYRYQPSDKAKGQLDIDDLDEIEDEE